MTDEPIDPRRLAVRVALIQGGLVLVLWLLLGYGVSKQIWLLDANQQRIMAGFFRWELPLLGLIFAVFIPAYRAYKLADEASFAVTLDAEFLVEVLGYPRRAAVLGMAASALIFFLGALELRVIAAAPVLEAAKVEVLGFITAVAFGIFSYFLLQGAMLPILTVAVRQGAVPPEKPAFPVTQKIVACCLAVAFVVIGLFGEISLTWVERFAEERAERESARLLREVAESSSALQIRDSAGWKKYFEANSIPAKGRSFAVIDTQGRVLATRPAMLPEPDRSIFRSEDLREQIGRLGLGAMTIRAGSVRVVSSLPLGTNWRAVALAAPDSDAVRTLLRSVSAIGLEVLFLSTFLAFAAGRGVTSPLRELDIHTRRFAKAPEIAGDPLLPTDDEVGTLSQSFTLMQGEIRGMQGRLRETERRAATAELLAGVAHEVRNPLFGITSTLAALQKELGADERFARHFEIVGKESVRLSRMMEEMLALQRVPRPARGPVRLRALLDSVVDWARAKFPEREFEIRIDCAADLSLPAADEERLRSVFTNLLENSLLSTPAKVHIDVRGERKESRVEIRFSDDGEGIGSEIEGHLFEPFVSGRPGGTGMGLAVCRQIVQEHGGKISAASRPGGPTIFSIEIPDRPVDAV